MTIQEFLQSRNWRNAASMRALFGACIIAIFPAILASVIAKPLGTPVFLITLVAWMLFVQMAPTNILYCPECRKRVKIGANRCHHCGIDVHS